MYFVFIPLLPLPLPYSVQRQKLDEETRASMLEKVNNIQDTIKEALAKVKGKTGSE